MLVACRALVQHLTELEEGALPAHDRLLARMHLAICSSCRRYREQLLAARRALSALSEVPALSAREPFAAFEARMVARRGDVPGAVVGPPRDGRRSERPS